MVFYLIFLLLRSRVSGRSRGAQRCPHRAAGSIISGVSEYMVGGTSRAWGAGVCQGAEGFADVRFAFSMPGSHTGLPTPHLCHCQQLEAGTASTPGCACSEAECSRCRLPDAPWRSPRAPLLPTLPHLSLAIRIETRHKCCLDLGQELFWGSLYRSSLACPKTLPSAPFEAVVCTEASCHGGTWRWVRKFPGTLGD